MNEKVFQNALFVALTRKGAQILCPNYTPKGWWECDLFCVTSAGYAVEYEIKLTKADFMKDASKQDNSYDARHARAFGRETSGKHDLLAARSTRGPSRFFYVTPVGLLSQEEIPEWAGLIELECRRGWWRPSEVKSAPRLHKEKLSASMIEHCKTVFYYRFWNLRQRVWPATPYHHPIPGVELQTES